MEDHFGMSILLDATLGANHDLPESSPNATATATANALGVHQCRVCQRSYERADHLNRHLKSHENARPFHCSRCPKRFNRADLLSRHLATHERHSSRDPDRPLIKRTDRAAAACLACAASKSKCEDQKPCRRCRSKNIMCETNSSSLAGQTRVLHRNRSTVLNDLGNSGPIRDSKRALSDQTHSLHDLSSAALPEMSAGDNAGEIQLAISGHDLPSKTAFRGNEVHHTITQDEPPSAALYGTNEMDGILFGDVNDMLFGPNISEFNQDLDVDFWDFNFEGVKFPVSNSPFDISGSQNLTSSSQSTTPNITRDISKGYAAFKRSPWLWTPAPRDNIYSDTENIALDEVSISSGLTPSSTGSLPTDSLTQTHLLDASLRDALFAIVLRMIMNKAATPVPAFPPLEILNHILHIFFVRQSYQVDHWIHSPTLSIKACDPHLIMALISAGSTFISVPAVWKMGLALQEVVRRSLGEVFESNNRMIRDLQSHQAFMLGLDVGLWSGFKRKMEIAESFGQPLITMLRRAGAFAAPEDSDLLIPVLSDSGERLDNKWRKWVERESFKRLAIHLFIHDTRSSAALQKPPLVLISELHFSAPASRDLWLANTAAKWKQKYLTKRPSPLPIPRMLDIMHDTSLFDVLRDHVDVSLTSLAILHGFWSQIWAFHDASRFFLSGQNEQGNATHRLLLTAQHREIFQDLQSFATKISEMPQQPSGIVVIVEVFMVTLHISPDELQRFAGKAGEEEASRAAINLQKWMPTMDARKAAWHAGQVYRAAKLMPPAELRDFHAIAVYFASLTLWAYGLISSSNGVRESGAVALLSRTRGERDKATLVSLDGPETRETRLFLSTGQGIPGLNYPYIHGEIFQSLENPNMALKIGREIYRNNFPATDEPLPPLVENLGNLMRDLGSSPGSRFSRSASESVEK